MEGITINRSGSGVQKSLLNNEEWDLSETEKEILSALEFLEMSPNLKNEIQEIDSLKTQEQNCDVIEEFYNTKKKSLRQTNDNNEKMENKVPSVDSPTCLKFTVDSSDLEKEIDFSFTKKKKKKKSAVIQESKILAEDENSTASIVQEDIIISDFLTSDANSDYSYDFLLSRVFDLMRENSNVDTTVRKKLIIKPPQVLRAGTKKTSFANFLELCKAMRRSPQHVQSFLIVELGTNGSVDSNGQLVIKGKFHQKQLEAVLRRYIKEYVTCHTCHSPDTMLLKQTRLCFLQCEACGSRCSVPIIKSGFQAVINKRAAVRAKCN